MPRIVLVGAGSVEFTRNLLGDFLSYPELVDAEIVLHDIDPDRLATAERMARWTAGALAAEPTIRGSLDPREALAGAAPGRLRQPLAVQSSFLWRTPPAECRRAHRDRTLRGDPRFDAPRRAGL